MTVSRLEALHEALCRRLEAGVSTPELRRLALAYAVAAEGEGLMETARAWRGVAKM